MTQPLHFKSVNYTTAKPGPRLVTLSYLTTNLSWQADYVALFDEAKLGPLSERKTKGVRIGKGYFFGPARKR